MLRHGSLAVSLILSTLFLFSGCSSKNKKAELREKVIQQSGFMCEFINGEQHRQVEIELNVLMAKRCDTEKPYSMTNYKTSAEVNGVLFCCRTKDTVPVKSVSTTSTSSPALSPAAGSSTKKPSEKALGSDLNIDIEPGQ
ncbi:MAG: hypothetical protein ACK5W9_02830 [Bdellovibrionales bacterium]